MTRPASIWTSLSLVLVLAVQLAFVANAPAQNMVLDYLVRYDCQDPGPGGPDHLMDVLALSGDRAIVSGNQGLALVHLDSLSAGGSQSVIDRLTGLNARDVYTADEQFFYVDLIADGEDPNGGFAVVRLIGGTLGLLTTVSEDGVFFEKMCLAGGYLYVAAHAHGLRIYDVTNPFAPALAGSLGTGLTDAFDVDVAGDTAYLADGGGGLKIVDVSDKENPSLIGGEDVSTAEGTAEAVSISNGHVYVASGGAGVAFYPGGDPGSRVLYPVDACAKDLAWLPGHLAVADMAGVLVFAVELDGSLTRVAGEVAHRLGTSAKLRLCSGVGATWDGRILCANWNTMDVYELLPAVASSQPDIDASHQRIRFSPDGGNASVTVTNDGAAALIINNVSSDSPSFACDYHGGILAPGASVECEITCDPGGGAGTIGFMSNDPDEGVLPIQVFGATPFPDPGEEAPDFTLPLLSRDEFGVWSSQLVTLRDQRGKIVWFQAYASW